MNYAAVIGAWKCLFMHVRRTGVQAYGVREFFSQEGLGGFDIFRLDGDYLRLAHSDGINQSCPEFSLTLLPPITLTLP